MEWPECDRAFWRSVGAAQIHAELDAGADANARVGAGDTPLHRIAKYSGTPAALDALLDRGADINISVGNSDGDTPLHLAVRFNENPVMVETLLARGADVNAGNSAGNTPSPRCGQRQG